MLNDLMIAIEIGDCEAAKELEIKIEKIINWLQKFGTRSEARESIREKFPTKDADEILAEFWDFSRTEKNFSSPYER